MAGIILSILLEQQQTLPEKRIPECCCEEAGVKCVGNNGAEVVNV
jgi:hypothetical protein